MNEIEDLYELSPMQQGILFHCLTASDPGVYLVTVGYALHGRLDVDAFERAWQRVVDRHPTLRTSLHWANTQKPLQAVHRDVRLHMERHDWRTIPEAEQVERFSAYIDNGGRRLELDQAPLMHVTLIQTAAERYRLFWTFHHVMLEGWSASLVLEEVFAFYRAFSRGEDLDLPARRPYRDYILWLQGQDPAKAEAYWRKSLKGFGAPTTLERGPSAAAGPAAEGSVRYSRRLSPATSGALQVLAQRNQLTLNTILQGAWALLLARYSGQEDVLFGSVVSGRQADLPGADSMIGLFVNTLPARVRARGQDRLLDWMKELQARQLEMRRYEYSSLVEVQGWSEVPRGTRLFDTLFAFENWLGDVSLRDRTGELQVLDVRSVPGATDYPLTVAADPGPPLTVAFTYDRRRFEADQVARMSAHFETLLAGMAAQPAARLSELPLLSEAERRQVVVEWNETASEYPREAGLGELFAEQVKRSPEAEAAVFEGERLSYRELNRRANQLARYLRRRGVGPEVRVGICVERSLQMVVGLLGIVKAGAAYVPLDPSYPRQRLAFMLSDSAVGVLLTQESLVSDLPGATAVVCLDRDWADIAREGDDDLASGADGDNLAYVIYTSGSTGTPKGVAVPHRAVSRLVLSTDYVKVEPGDRIAQASNASFDAATFEVWGALLNGACVVGISRDVSLAPRDMAAELREQRITALFLTTALFNQIAREEEGAFSTLKHLLFGGEAADPSTVQRVLSNGRPSRLLHVYGPTETTTFATWHLVEEVGEGAITVPIGRPIANSRSYVLDDTMRPVPVGVAGELYLGGDGLARGYLGRAESTAERFVPDPFAAEGGGRLYRTGDLVRHRADGAVEFVQRKDHQVKVRGYRIELGEIESVLERHAAVGDAVAVVREDQPGDKRVVAYVTGRDGETPEVRELQAYLKQRLPDYMVPSAFVVLDSLPLNVNGKVDRPALPLPDVTVLGRPGKYTSPRTPIEEGLAEIWARVLGVSSVGIHDSFFELGGHSLLATRVVSLLRNTFQVELPLRALFEAPTVAGLAQKIDEARRGSGRLLAPPLQAVARDRDLPLSFAQQRLWFLDQMESGAAYNIPWAIRLTGPLDAEALEAALNEIVRRHEALRTAFPAVEGSPRQVVAPVLDLRLARIDLRAVPDGEREVRRLAREEAHRPFDVARGPLLRATLVRLGEIQYALFLTLYHITADGWSMGVFFSELSALYNALSTGSASPLSPLPIQYADFALWQRDWFRGEVLGAQLSYWKRQLAGLATLELPTDRPRPAVQTYRGAVHTLAFPRSLHEGLKSLSQRQGATLFMTVLAGFQVLLHRYTGQEDIVVGTPIANRNRSEIEDLIGFFVNTLVMRTDLSGDPTFRELLGRVKEAALEGYDHQDLPFEKLVEELQPERDMSRNPLFQVSLVLVNSPWLPLDLRGLTVAPMELDFAATRFDLELILSEGPAGLRGLVYYSTDLFDGSTIDRMMQHFVTVLEGIVAAPERRVSEVPLLAEAARRQLLSEWNDTAVTPPREVTVPELIEAQAARTPEATAVVFEGRELSYAELNRRANQLAHHLRSGGVGPETRVGIFMERSLEMVVGLLGIWKAGGAYLPLEPTYPPERLAFMAADAQVPVLLTQERLAAQLPRGAARVLRLDADWAEVSTQSGLDPARQVSGDNLAYVIYTSGSTGRPKGAMNTHAGISNRLRWMQAEYGLDESDRVLQKTPFGFDVSVWEFFWPLMVGARLVVARPGGHQDSRYLVDLIREEGITTLHFVPSMLRAFLEEEAAGACASLERVICSGEALPWDLQQRFFSRLGAQLHNLYGPTEAAVDVTYWACRRGDERRTVPIGRPVWNTRTHVLDGCLEPVPVGVPGELYLGGVQLGRGYLNRPDLTAERFVADPLGAAPGARLYRTGDVARYLPDGSLEYLGRVDHQVKIRGFRIELGEIETALARRPEVRAAVVMAREDAPGDQRLVAYVVPAAQALGGTEQAQESQKDHVSQWQALYDETYGQASPAADPTFDIAGWNSSYTGLPMTDEEMREWLEQTTGRILSRRPRRVLEIGCGTGLLLFRIAPHCAQYTATDFSAKAVRQLEQQLRTGGGLPHVTVRQQTAENFEGLPKGGFDAVILNSVVQYFPSVEYLLSVIEGAVEAVAPGGFVFVGDVRSLPLLEAYHASVQTHKAAPSTSRTELRQRVRRHVAQEEELVIDPTFFAALKQRLPGIRKVQVHLKRGTHHNELNRFRYDVVLGVGGDAPSAADVQWLDWQAEELSVARVERLLRERQPDRLAIARVPNARVSAAVKAAEWLGDGEGGPETAGELTEALAAAADGAVDPESLWALERDLPYSVEIGWWSGSTMDRGYDVFLRRRTGNGHERPEVETPVGRGGRARPWTAYASNPLQATMARKLVPRLRSSLAETLPEYMVPSAFVTLEALPLSPNGKVDRRALPAPDQARSHTARTFVAPRTPLEQALAAIWKEVLDVDEIGVQDGFFELGGHSLKATQVLSRIRTTFDVDLRLRQLFETPVLGDLASAVEQALVRQIESISEEEAQSLLGAPSTPVANG